MTTSVCQRPCLPCLPWDPVWPSVPVPPLTPVATDAAETEPTPKAPEPTLLVHPQPSVSNMNGQSHQKKRCRIRCCRFTPFDSLLERSNAVKLGSLSIITSVASRPFSVTDRISSLMFTEVNRFDFFF